MSQSLQRHRWDLSAALIALLLAAACWLRPNQALSASASAKGTDDPQFLDPADTQDLVDLQSKFRNVVNRCAPAVVAISAAESADDSDDAVRAQDLNTQKLQAILDKTTRTVGTGVIFDSDGYILTNEHVVEDSQQYWVTSDDRKVYPAIVVASDPRADLAVLKIPASHLPTVNFNLNPVQRGQWALTLGNPYGLATEGEMSLSVGVVSAVNRSLPKLASKENRLYSGLIQTTAQINPGNSGGPLFDLHGDVVGINTAVILPQRQSNGLGFAIPITTGMLAEVDQLRRGKEIVYGYIGVTVTTPTYRQRKDAGLNDDQGVSVESIEAGSPAAVPEGLRAGDLVASINGQAVADSDQFVRLVGSAAVDKKAEFVVYRGGWKQRINLVPVKRPVQFAIYHDNQRMYWRGLVLGPVPSHWAEAAGSAKKNGSLQGILVIDIQEGSPLKKRGICPGTVITTVAGKAVNSLLDMQRLLNDLPVEQFQMQTDSTLTAQTAAMSK